MHNFLTEFVVSNACSFSNLSKIMDEHNVHTWTATEPNGHVIDMLQPTDWTNYAQ
jgi:hypothetical protein